jgi:nitrite reductase/ring-hydroxylating ferredoxin subunit
MKKIKIHKGLVNKLTIVEYKNNQKFLLYCYTDNKKIIPKVYKNLCLHNGAELHNCNPNHEMKISCPWHGCTFDLKTGKGIAKLRLLNIDYQYDGEYIYVK